MNLSLLQPIAPYLRVAVLIATAAGPAAVAWTMRGQIAEAESQRAVNTALAEQADKFAGDLAKERAARKEFQDAAGRALQTMVRRLDTLRIGQEEVAAGIAEERVKNRTFYDQPLPDGGRTQWMRARNAATESQPASSASSPR